VPPAASRRTTGYGEHLRIIVNMDWTDFDDDDQTEIVLSLQTDHGRSTPTLWKTVLKSELKGKRNAHEDAILTQLRDVLAPETRVTIVADRGFGDTKLFQFLGEFGFHFVIRFNANMTVASASGEARPVGSSLRQSYSEWPSTRRARRSWR
jgi:hypothetical protein